MQADKQNAEQQPVQQSDVGLDARLLAATPTASFTVDGRGRVRHWNEAIERLTGVAAKDVVGKKAWMAFFTKKQSTPIELALRSEEEEVDDAFTFTAPHSQKPTKVRFTATPVLDDEGEPVGAVATLAEQNGHSKAQEHLDGLPTPVMSIDRDFNVTYLNQTGASVVGLTPEQAVGKKCYDLFKTSHCRTSQCRCAQAMQHDAVRTGETVADPEGLNLPIQYTATPIKDEKGEIVGALEYVMDITATKAAMNEAQQKVDNLNNLPTPVMAIDREFNVTFINPAGANAVGQTVEQAKGRKCYDLFKTPHCRTAECRCTQAMQQNGVFTGETVVDPSGIHLPVQYTGSPIKNEKGEIVGALEFVVDISETKRAIQDAKQKVDNLNNLPTPVMTLDREFNITFLNPAGASVVGLTPEQAVGRKCYELFRTPHCRTPECRCTQAMQQDGVFSGETAIDPHGKNIAIEYTGAPIKNSEGEIIGALEFVVDISERKQVLSDIIGVAEQLAQNNLTARADGQYQGDYLKIAESLNQAIASQHDTLAQVAEAVEQVSSASSQIASASQSVAQGASEQAASLEETSSSLEEMSSMTKQNAENTLAAKSLTNATKEVAEKGTLSMSEMTSAMGKIRQAAQSTAQIIRDINEIAFQTNLLALNAAVEAARAGEAGRGFAVVAEEVRNLAQRSKDAAQRTEELINESVSLAENGQVITQDVGGNLEQIVESVNKVAGLVAEIATASDEQSRGIEQVNLAVSQMDAVTQQAAANAEESSSATEELSSQAMELASLVGRFKLARNHSPQHQLAPPARQPRGLARGQSNNGRNGHTHHGYTPPPPVDRRAEQQTQPEDYENDPDFIDF
jgi:methyl-accepting chemotaxis protein